MNKKLLIASAAVACLPQAQHKLPLSSSLALAVFGLPPIQVAPLFQEAVPMKSAGVRPPISKISKAGTGLTGQLRPPSM